MVEVNVESTSGRSCLLRFSVADTGIGISEEDQQRIFAPFTQADASSTRHFAGTGLGLAIASHLINCFHGNFWVESAVGAGSTFFFTARFAVSDELESKQQSLPLVVERLFNLPILVADDNQTSRESIAKLLDDWHMAPVPASNAQSALEKLEAATAKGQPIPLAVIDALMPEQDGFQLVEQITESPTLGTKTILMLSSADRIAFKERCKELQFDGVLEKPISQSNLLDAIVTALGVATIDAVRPNELAPIQPSERALSVMLVEDTPANRKVVERVLAKRGHNVSSAVNGREAVDLFHQHHFDVILMDVQMPSMDGFQATEAIRTYEEEHQNSNRIPIIAMTAHAMVGDKHRCLAVGMDDYISKPINIRRLIDIVEGYGRERHNSKESESANGLSISRKKLTSHDAHAVGVMDLEKALRRLDGDRTLLVDLIGFFLEDYPTLIVRMDEAAAAEDAALLERAAHSLKGLVANFDAKLAKDLAQKLENAANNRDLTHVQEFIESLKSATAELAANLDEFRNAEAS